MKVYPALDGLEGAVALPDLNTVSVFKVEPSQFLNVTVYLVTVTLWDATELSYLQFLIAIALTVDVDDSVKAPLYLVLDEVGVEPLVV